jgi:hypothetical protein
MSYEILGIYDPSTEERKIAGVIFSDQDTVEPGHPSNQHIYFSNAEMSQIASLPEDQQSSYALSLAETKKN